ncbi:Cytochrome c, mono-and diheme variants [Bradyrhizobium lablabi]|uniref:Cytochrome c, mono-and diheme variants n=1 Tax=Bradyrhizobium lablabi TaxID=722472 RepID=A0A1M6RT77_9BRAD|nr:Cytochrome c, mono-and diheme variants [Bradyrhizobium lablabi]
MIKGRFGWTAAYFAAVAITASALTTVRPVRAQQDSEVDQAKIDQGKVTFAQKCSHCHGPNMVNAGTIAPDLRKFPDDKERFFTTVKLGKNGKMPPWGDLLSDDEIACLWAYMSSRRNP